MAKSDLTYQLEETIALATWRPGQIGCPEVGLGDEGIVDYATISLSGDREVCCYELKISRSDFLSDAKKTFIGDLNYYVIPTALWNSVRSHMEPGIGCWCMDEGGQMRLVLEAERRECSLPRRFVARKIIYGLRREHDKIAKERWDGAFSRRKLLSAQALRECMPTVMESASTENSRYGCAGVRLPGAAAPTDFATIDLAGKRTRGQVRCYAFAEGPEDVDPVADGLVGDFNFYVCPVSAWGAVAPAVPKWAGMWCLDEHGKALRKKRAKHVGPQVSRSAAISAIAQGLDRERMMAVEAQWRRRQYAKPVTDATQAEIAAGDLVERGGATWRVMRIEYDRDGTVLVPMLVLESMAMPGVTNRVSPHGVRRSGDGTG